MKIICMGDSITYGHGLSDLSQRWSDLVSTRTGHTLVNRGVSGDTTGGMLARCQTQVFADPPDAVVLLDYPRRLCLLRALRRILTWRGRTRPDMAAGCPERVDAGFIRWIWDFHRTQRPQVLELLNRWEGEKHVFRSPRACADFLSRL